jgi:DNA-binding transcriptional MerR regulator
MRCLRTSEIARSVGVHPNTVRLYEEWGFLPPIPRSPGGYRLFTQDHLDQMRLARMALDTPWPGRDIRRSALALVRKAASGHLNTALEQAHHHLALIRSERDHAEAAAQFLERWAQGSVVDDTAKPLLVGEAARLLEVTTDMLRNWERNGLIRVPRDSHSGYRLYGAGEIGRLRVIRVLRQARYSTMSILRMVLHLDQGGREDLRQVLDTPRPDEDIIFATDRWLSTLTELEQRAQEIIVHLEGMMHK